MRIQARVVARLFRVPILRLEADIHVDDDGGSPIAIARAGTTASRRALATRSSARSAGAAADGQQRVLPTTGSEVRGGDLARAEAILAEVDAQLGPPPAARRRAG